MNKKLLIFPVLLILAFIIRSIWLNYRENSLKESNSTWAIVTQPVQPTTRGGGTLRYKFLVKSHWYKSSEDGAPKNTCHKNLKVGDTVYIRYAVSDPEITELLHCYWNDQTRKEMVEFNRKSK